MRLFVVSVCRLRIGITSEVITGMSFIELYCSFILACQAHGRKAGDSKLLLPFAIMTSGDTHLQTLQLMEENDAWRLRSGPHLSSFDSKAYFGLKPAQAQFFCCEPFWS